MHRAATPSPRAGRSGRLPGVLLLFAVALALRVAWVLVPGPQGPLPAVSARTDEVALHLSQGSGFTIADGSRLEATAEIPPLVPWISSLIYRSTGHRYRSALMLQCAIGALLPLLVAALGRSLFGDPAGVWGGWLVALHPLLVVAAGELAAGVTLCVTLTLALLLSAEWVRTPRHARSLGTGLAWGLAILTHPAALPAPIVTAAWAWRPLGLAVGPRGRAAQLGLLLLGIALVVGPWSLRNLVETRALALVTRGDGGALTTATAADPWSAAARSAAPAAERGPTEPELPVRASLLAVGRGWSVAMLALALWGLATTLRGDRRWFQSLPLLIILSLTVLSAGFAMRPDLRLPAEPLAGIYAAFGIEELRRQARVRRSGFRVVQGNPGPNRPGRR